MEMWRHVFGCSKDAVHNYEKLWYRSGSRHRVVPSNWKPGRNIDMRIFGKAVFATVAAIGFAGSFAQGLPAQQELPTQKVITLQLSKAIAEEVLAVCHAKGYKVTVIVVDATDSMKVLLRDDGSTMSSVQTGLLKTHTVIARGGNPTGAPAGVRPGDQLPPVTVPGTIYGMGGVPIKAGNQVIGALSVSGAPGKAGEPLGAGDAACANEAMAKFKDKIK